MRSNNQTNYNNQDDSIMKIKSNDENFNEKNFIILIKDNLLKMSQYILLCNYVELMKLETKAMYELDYSLIKNSFENDNLSYYSIENILGFKIIDYKKENDCEHIYCNVEVQLRNLTIIPSKNEIIKFDDMPTTTFKYIDVVRYKNISNDSLTNISVSCPMCGAELEINNIGRCIYCNSLLENNNTSWLINRIEDYYFFSENEK